MSRGQNLTEITGLLPNRRTNSDQHEPDYLLATTDAFISKTTRCKLPSI